MSKEVSDQVKSTAVHVSHMPSGNYDPSLQSIMDSLQLSDSNVYSILKGEIHELMDRLGILLLQFQQDSENYKEHYIAMPNNEAQTTLLKILGTQEETQKIIKQIESELQQYYKMVPYLLMLSPLMWLSNLSAKQVRDIQFRQSIMIQRDRCLREDDAKGFDDDNFLDAIEILCHVIVAGSEQGWKSNVIRNEVREVRTTIEDRTHGGEQKGRRKILGVF